MSPINQGESTCPSHLGKRRTAGMVAIMVAAIAGASAYAFTASNTGLAAHKAGGSAAAAVTGYAVSNVAYEWAYDGQTVTSFSFNLDAAANDVKAALTAAAPIANADWTDWTGRSHHVQGHVHAGGRDHQRQRGAADRGCRRERYGHNQSRNADLDLGAAGPQRPGRSARPSPTDRSQHHATPLDRPEARRRRSRADCGRPLLVPLRTNRNRRLDNLCGDRRHQHAAPVPHGRPRPGPGPRALPRGRRRRLPQRQAPQDRPPPDRRASATGRYIFKGDNNTSRPRAPPRDQLLGTLWFKVPGLAQRLGPLRHPATVGALVALGALLLGSSAFVKRRRRRGRRPDVTAVVPQASVAAAGYTAHWVHGLLVVAGAVLTPLLVFAILAYARPTASIAPVSHSYAQKGAFSYSADTVWGPAYPHGHATTGDPLFLRLVHTVRVRMAYSFKAPGDHRSPAPPPSRRRSCRRTAGSKRSSPRGASA